MSLIGSLDIGKRAIMAQTQALNIAGENISNVNTPGYSRKRIELKNTIHTNQEEINILETRRIRDQFIDKHIRIENQSLGNWEMKSQQYNQIERVFIEPSENGINNMLGEFWNSWEDLASNPENLTSRNMVIQRGVALAQNFNRIDSQLKDIRETANGYIEDRIEQVNQKASQIAYINTQIKFIEASGGEASGLRDNRDLLTDELSKQVNLTSLERDNGCVSLFIGGRAIVDEEKFASINIGHQSIDGMVVTTIKWSDDQSNVNINGGEIAGLIEIRDNVIPELNDKINQLAQTLINSVNKLHVTGYGLDGTSQRNFFVGTNAGNIKVNDDANTGVINHPERISTSANGQIGDNSIALQLARLSDIRVASDGSEVPDGVDAINITQFYNDTVNSLGSDIQLASAMTESAQMIVTDLEARREGVSGVSLDEESADLIKLQRAYESAAKYMAVINEMIGTLMEIGR
ncbi:MAG: Flagellar hook-associated protein 1 [Candidatus Poribacteria bacterium]|nr:Flagellar hook-associated protein 1 [Candidatus Poribacteria bacterium]